MMFKKSMHKFIPQEYIQIKETSRIILYISSKLLIVIWRKINLTTNYEHNLKPLQIHNSHRICLAYNTPNFQLGKALSTFLLTVLNFK